MVYEHACWWLIPFSLVPYEIPSVGIKLHGNNMMIIIGVCKSSSCSLLCVLLSSFAQLLILYTIPRCYLSPLTNFVGTLLL